jgi:hypothetical protein
VLVVLVVPVCVDPPPPSRLIAGVESSMAQPSAKTATNMGKAEGFMRF